MTEAEFNDKLARAKVLFDEKLKAAAEKSVPFANYVASKRSGNAIYISGQLPRDLLDGGKVITGKADNNDNIFDAKYAAAMCAMQVLLVIGNECIEKKDEWTGGLGIRCKTEMNFSKIKSCVQLQVFVNSAPDFINQHLVANGASDLIYEYLVKSVSRQESCNVMCGAPYLCGDNIINGRKYEARLQHYKNIVAQHTRCAVGVATLPLGALVEVGAVFEM